MYVSKSIPTLLPDAVLRCRKLQAAADVKFDEIKKLSFRRINKLEWQQQTFQKTLIERHQKWRMYDRAFRLKLIQELNTDLATAFKLRIIEDDKEQQLQLKSSIITKRISKSSSAYSKSNQAKASVNKGSQSAVAAQHIITKANHPTSVINQARKLSLRTSRVDIQSRRDTHPDLECDNDYSTVLFRILSNIAHANDDFTKRKRVFEACKRRLIATEDDRYFNLIEQLVPQKILRETGTDV